MIMKLLHIACSGRICGQAMWLSPPGAGSCSAHELLGVYPPKALGLILCSLLSSPKQKLL